MTDNAIPWFTGRHPIPDAFWRTYTYFDLYPLDGGASFIVDEFVGTRDDREITRKLLAGELLRPWGEPGNMDWLRFRATRHLERHCWLHRWYAVASLARTYWLDRDERVAETAFRILEDWAAKVGYPAGEAEVLAREEEALAFDRRFQQDQLTSRDEPCPWEWYDFQPAYRLLVLLCAAHLLRDSAAIRPRSQALRGWVRAHADSILWVTARYGFKPGNHHSLRMMSLYLAGVLVDDAHAAAWRETALAMQTRHLAEEFFADGMHKESLPGYLPFIVTHFREVLLAGRANGHELPDLYERTLRRSLALLRALAMPDGTLPVINDGPRVGITATVALLKDAMPAPIRVGPCLHLHEDSGFPVFRDEQNYLLLDANDAHGTHVQAGKLGFILWHGGEPFVIEGGCCSYDHPRFQSYFRRGWAHSSLLVDGEEDAVWQAFWVWSERAHPVIVGASTGSSPFVAARSDGFRRLGVTFTRRIAHPDVQTFVISDAIDARGEAVREFAFRFLLAAPEARVDRAQGRLRVAGRRHVLELASKPACEIRCLVLESNFFGDMRLVLAFDFVRRSAASFRQTFRLTFAHASG